MMSDVIRQETAVFLVSILHGIALTFFYDILRALRRAFPHNLAVISAEDFLFWMVAGFLTFCLVFARTDGVIRAYVAVGIGLGVVFYHYSVSSHIVRLLSESMKILKKMWNFFWNCLAKSVRKTGRACKKVIEFGWKSGYNLFVKGRSATKGKHKRGRRYGKKKKASKQE